MPTTPQTGSRFASVEMLRALIDGDAGSFALADGVPAGACGRAEVIDGLSEVAAEIERLRLLEGPQYSDERTDEGESPRGAVIGGAFILGLLSPILVHATSLSLGAASKNPPSVREPRACDPVALIHANRPFSLDRPKFSAIRRASLFGRGLNGRLAFAGRVFPVFPCSRLR